MLTLALPPTTMGTLAEPVARTCPEPSSALTAMASSPTRDLGTARAKLASKVSGVVGCPFGNSSVSDFPALLMSTRSCVAAAMVDGTVTVTITIE